MRVSLEDIKLDAYVNDKKIGKLFYDPNRQKFIFEYNEHTDVEDFVSLVMPVKFSAFKAKKIDCVRLPGDKVEYPFHSIHPPLIQSLPEGYLKEILSTIIGQMYEIDVFEDEKLEDLLILGYTGRLQIGRVKLAHEGESPEVPEADLIIDPNEINDAAGDRREVIDEYIRRLGLYSGVSGIQPKVLANLPEDLMEDTGPRLSLPLGKWIIKFTGDFFPSICVNEYFCMMAAKKAGLETPKYKLNHNGTVLLIERFDLNQSFEEVCQLLGLLPKNKYRGDYFLVAKFLSRLSSKRYQKKTLEDFYKSIVLSVLVRNGDAHLKNFGLVYTDYNNIRLSPIYDIVTSTVYIPNDKMALEFLVGKDWPDMKGLLRFAKMIGIPGQKAKEIIDQTAEAVIETMPEFQRYINENPQHITMGRQILNEWREGLESIKKDYLHISTAVLSEAAKRDKEKRLKLSKFSH